MANANGAGLRPATTDPVDQAPPDVPGQRERNGAPGDAASKADLLARSSAAARARSRMLRDRCRAVAERSSLAQEHSRKLLEKIRAARSANAALRNGSGEERSPSIAGRLIAAQEEERRRISLELHDAVSQRVAATCISLRRLQSRMRDDAAAAEQLEEVLDVLGELVYSVRHMSHAMHPPVLELAGLGAALRGHCLEMRVLARLEVAVQADDLPPLPREAGLCLYRVAQEALSNVVSHAGVTRATLTVARQNSSIELEVSDTGIGFDRSHVEPGLGLVGMAERVRLLGGTLAVESRPGAGTVIRARIPLDEPAPDPADDADPDA